MGSLPGDVTASTSPRSRRAAQGRMKPTWEIRNVSARTTETKRCQRRTTSRPANQRDGKDPPFTSAPPPMRFPPPCCLRRGGATCVRHIPLFLEALTDLLRHLPPFLFTVFRFLIFSADSSLFRCFQTRRSGTCATSAWITLGNLLISLL